MKIVFHQAALADIRSISDYISRDNPAAARRVIGRIRSAIRRLSHFPHSARAGGEPGTRELVVPRLPYIVVYRVVEDRPPTFVEIIAVFHAARDREKP
jgi:addiction module RelE/StbE family toxin